MTDDARNRAGEVASEAPAAEAPSATSPTIGEDASPTSLEAYLPQPTGDAPPPPLPTGLRSATLRSLEGRVAQVLLRGQPVPLAASVAPEVELELLREAMPGGTVLVEVEPTGALWVVGILTTRKPRELKLRAGTITIEGDDEVLLRAGRSAVRLRADGDVEVVGSRISAASRGVFRIVGRLLRLN